MYVYGPVDDLRQEVARAVQQAACLGLGLGLGLGSGLGLGLVAAHVVVLRGQVSERTLATQHLLGVDP